MPRRLFFIAESETCLLSHLHFTFMHLADSFNQHFYFLSVCVFPGNLRVNVRVNVESSGHFMHSEQLVVCFRESSKRLLITKQDRSHWTVDAIALAYASVGLQCPIGARTHSSIGMASSWAWPSRVSIGEVCAAACGSLPSSFTRFYNLDIPALLVRILSL